MSEASGLADASVELTRHGNGPGHDLGFERLAWINRRNQPGSPAHEEPTHVPIRPGELRHGLFDQVMTAASAREPW